VTNEFSAVPWRKSSWSSGAANNCVEVALGEAVGIRDSKDRTAGQLTVAPSAFAAFLDYAKRP